MAAPVAHGSSPDQGLNQSCNCELHHSCGNTGSLNPLCQAGIKLSPPQCLMPLQSGSYSQCARVKTPVSSLQTVILCCYHGVVKDGDSI